MLFSPEQSAVLKETFDSFRQEPYNRFVVHVRHIRAEQIRRLLSEPSSIDLKTFLDEVWNFETRTIWRSYALLMAIFKETRNGEYVEQLLGRKQLFLSQPITWNDLESALVSGDIELHGNYIWHQGSRGYDITKTKSEEQKIGQIQQIIGILTDSQLNPVKKALSIQRVEGFGENNATGLVMIFHPEHFSLVNPVTRKALEILNVPVSSIKNLFDIQNILQYLKKELGAKDFFELDWFLYLIMERKYLQGLPEEASSKTWLDYITRVLQTTDEPLSYTEIARRVISLGLATKGKTPAKTASRILTTHPELFEKVDRGTYRLKDSRGEPISARSEEGDIPKKQEILSRILLS